MFKFLKKKLKDAVSSISKKVEEEGEKKEVEVEEKKIEAPVEEKISEEPVVEEEAEEEISEEQEEPGLTQEELEEVDKLIEEAKGEGETVEEPEVEDVSALKVEEPTVVEEVAEPTVVEEKKEAAVKEQPPKVPAPEVVEAAEAEPAEVKKEVPEEKEPFQAEEKKIEQLEKGAKILEEEEKEVVEEQPKKKGFFKRLFSKEETKEKEEPLVEQQPRPELKEEKKEVNVKEEKKETAVKEKSEATVKEQPSKAPAPEVIEAAVKEKAPAPEEKKGFFSKITKKITTTTISEKQFNDMFWDLELALLENNVAVEVIEKLKSDLSAKLVDQPLKRGGVENEILGALKSSIEGLFVVSPINLIETVKNHEGPYSICFVGINGAGKTTTIAKVAKLLQDNGLSVVIAACDTFRAAAIDQLESHANKLGVKMIKHDYGADPAAVAFDAIAHAKKEKVDCVLIDTAGRLHSNVNLMDELHKIIRVAKPDMNIFIGEAVTGNDCVEQAKKFNETVGISGIILSKADVDEKGGASISVSYVTGKPILYLGTGQEYKDLEPFDSEKLLASLGI